MPGVRPSCIRDAWDRAKLPVFRPGQQGCNFAGAPSRVSRIQSTRLLNLEADPADDHLHAALQIGLFL